MLPNKKLKRINEFRVKQIAQLPPCHVCTYGSDHTTDGQTNGNTKAFQTFI